jgi:adenosylcobinamide-phosphate synthase
MKSMRRGVVLLLALMLDLIIGDPPNRYHPVAWMGTAIGKAQRRAPRQGRAGQFAFGAALAVGGASAVAGLGALVSAVLSHLPSVLAWLLEAAVLKSTLSWRGLRLAATEVEVALQTDLPEARRLLNWHLVSRDTSQLDASQVAAAAVESVAENTSDGIVAPMFYYAIGGLPAALAYRFLNTGDAMLGYHDEEREWMGKAPARLDDLANLIPARLTALLLMAASAISGQDSRRAVQVWQRDSGKTASPNAGHPMSVMAGALDVELEKVGHYCLGKGQRRPTATDIGRSVRVMNTATVLAGGALIGASLLAGLWLAACQRASAGGDSYRSGAEIAEQKHRKPSKPLRTLRLRGEATLADKLLGRKTE